MNKTAFITGATSGIGRACAEKFAENHYDIFITGRRKHKLAEVKTFIEEKYGVQVTTCCFDVRDRAASEAAIEALKLNSLDVLINNAGLALGREPFDEANIDDWETMIDTNIKGMLYISRALLPMLKKAPGHVINIGSVAGKEVYENGNVYCATKFAADAVSQAMRIDLLKHGIKVTAINPGAVETEFSLVRFKDDAEKAAAAYAGYQPLTASNIAEAAFWTASLPHHVCINDLTITCLQQANAIYFHKK